MSWKKIIVDSDIIVEHLVTQRDHSVLRQLMKHYFCYTTVFNAIELFAAAESLKETEAVEDAMDSMKILGINPKSAKNIASVVAMSRKKYSALIAGICIESKLPIVTNHPKRFMATKKLVVLRPKQLLSI